MTGKNKKALTTGATGQEKTYLGNLEAKRDWGHAKDYIEGMYLMLQQDEPEDFVLSTGKTYTIRRLCELAFGFAGIALEWMKRTSIWKRGIRS